MTRTFGSNFFKAKFRFLMKEITDNSTIDFLHLKEYELPSRNKSNIFYLHPPILRNKGGVNFDIFDYETLFNDEAVKKIIREGNTIGCFYIESPGMRSLLKKLNVETFSMLTAASSVIRPGVAESGMMQEFIARHKDPSKRKYLIPEMEKFLGETYGVMIYQEDVIKVAHHIAGLSLEEADLLRRAMSGKMRSHNAMNKLKNNFFVSCEARGLTKNISQELWRQIESFAGYAFCKAHSASFAVLSYQVAYLKVHYPAEFMAAVLSNGGGYYAAAVYIWEAKRLGIKILLPCINRSEANYKGKERLIRIGLNAIKNFSSASIKIIISERNQNGNYKSLLDFLVRTKIGIEETKSLIKCGAMNCFKQTRPTLMRLLDIYIHHRKILDNSYNNLFMSDSFELEKDVVTNIDYSIEEKCQIEFETFDFMVTRHPLEFFFPYLNNKGNVTAVDMHRHNGKKIKMIGWYISSKRIRTKKGEIMKFLSVEDLTGTYEAVIFPKVYSEIAEKTLSMGPYVFEGRVDAAGGNNLIVEKLELITVQALKSSLQKDSVENQYFGDEEKIYENDFALAEMLNQGKLISAYLA